MKSVQSLQDVGIYVWFDESDITKATAMILGPENTPYAHGILYFRILFPVNYPFVPPNVMYVSTSRHRIHPNLYVGRSHHNFEGKVCLSILNTWSGPKWTQTMDLSTVLLSIQSLLDEYPLKNENKLSNNTAEDNSGYYPIFGSSLGQYTNNVRYWATPNNGKCTPPSFCGALYKNKHIEIEKTPNAIPFSSKEIRVNYYGSHKLTCPDNSD